MPNIKSAKKRVLVTAKKNLKNRAIESEVKTAIKKFNAAIDTNRIEDAEKLLPETMSIIDSAAQKGVIHKNTAANKKAALSKKLSDVKSGKVAIVIKKDNKTIAAEKALATRQVREAIRAENAAKSAERAAAKEAAKETSKASTKKTAKTVSKKKESVAEEEPKEAVKEKKATTEKKPAKKAETAKKAEPKKEAAESAEPKKEATESAEPKKTAAKKPAAKKPAEESKK